MDTHAGAAGEDNVRGWKLQDDPRRLGPAEGDVEDDLLAPRGPLGYPAERHARWADQPGYDSPRPMDCVLCGVVVVITAASLRR